MSKASSMPWKWQHPLDKNYGKHSDDDDSSLGSEEEDIGKSEARMKAELQKMAEKDPDFHKYLEENESSLLEFGDDELEDDDDVMENDDVMEDDEKNGKQKQTKTKKSTSATTTNGKQSTKED